MNTLKSVIKQYVILKEKYGESKEVSYSSLRKKPSSGHLRMKPSSSDSLGLKSLLRSPIHNKPNIILKPIQSQRTTIKDYKTQLQSSDLTPSILSVMWKESIGISDCFDIIGSGSKSRNKGKDAPSSSGQPVPVGLGVGLPNQSKSSSSSVQPFPVSSSSSSVQPFPVSLEVGLPKNSSVDLVSTFIPLCLFSFIYFSSYSVSDLLTILENMGMNQIWLKEMLGISEGSSVYNISPFFNYDSCYDLAIEVQEEVSNGDNYQFLRIVGLVAGSVGVGVIVLWLASQGLSR